MLVSWSMRILIVIKTYSTLFLKISPDESIIKSNKPPLTSIIDLWSYHFKYKIYRYYNHLPI